MDIKEIEKEVINHGKKISNFDRFLDKQFPDFEKRMHIKFDEIKKSINGGVRTSLSWFQFLSILAVLIGILIKVIVE